MNQAIKAWLNAWGIISYRIREHSIDVHGYLKNQVTVMTPYELAKPCQASLRLLLSKDVQVEFEVKPKGEE